MMLCICTACCAVLTAGACRKSLSTMARTSQTCSHTLAPCPACAYLLQRGAGDGAVAQQEPLASGFTRPTKADACCNQDLVAHTHELQYNHVWYTWQQQARQHAKLTGQQAIKVTTNFVRIENASGWVAPALLLAALKDQAVASTSSMRAAHKGVPKTTAT
jgi:hypothetical protein